MKISSEEQAFLDRNQLPLAYLEAAKQWFSPLVDNIVNSYTHNNSPQVIGINGCQGSGKSTLADYLCTVVAERLGETTVSLSLDDFYLTKVERNHLAATIHPLLATRGVPGTHDVQLAIDSIQSLVAGKKTLITRFDKSIDDIVSTKKFRVGDIYGFYADMKNSKKLLGFTPKFSVKNGLKILIDNWRNEIKPIDKSKTAELELLRLGLLGNNEK